MYFCIVDSPNVLAIQDNYMINEEDIMKICKQIMPRRMQRPQTVFPRGSYTMGIEDNTGELPAHHEKAGEVHDKLNSGLTFS
jgi:hypothetical protein